VEKRTAELQEALSKLSEVSQTKSNFISNISHELRTPLTHIKGYLDLLVSADLGPVAPEQQRALGIMQRSTERLERLIEDLILFSTAERGEVTIDPAPFNLGNLCLAVVNRAIPRASEQKIDVQLEIGTDNTIVDGDEEKIGWILTELLDNAIKFTPSQKTVGIFLTPEEGYLRITVRDTGIGIPEERLNEIFEPFHQLDGSSTRRYGGTGLGLALVRRIIEAHGSIIQVFSKVGEGSSFEFLLKRVSVAEKK
jgi:signal transduction histidine kinase